MSVGGQEVDCSLNEHSFRQVLRVGAKGAQQTAGSDLHQAAPVYQGAKQFRSTEDAPIAFRMRENPHEALLVKLFQEWFKGKIQFVGKLQQYMTPVVRQGEHLTAGKPPEHAIFDAYIGPRQYRERYLGTGQQLL
jgi:hypothetical protein